MELVTLRILALLPRLRRIAFRLAAGQGGGVDGDDLLQSMSLLLLERSGDAHFWLGNDSYVTAWAAWRARDLLRAEGRRAAEPLAERAFTERFEADVEVRVVVGGLGAGEQELAALLAQGCRQAEAARVLGVSRQRVNRRVARIRVALSARGLD